MMGLRQIASGLFNQESAEVSAAESAEVDSSLFRRQLDAMLDRLLGVTQKKPSHPDFYADPNIAFSKFIKGLEQSVTQHLPEMQYVPGAKAKHRETYVLEGEAAQSLHSILEVLLHRSHGTEAWDTVKAGFHSSPLLRSVVMRIDDEAHTYGSMLRGFLANASCDEAYDTSKKAMAGVAADSAEIVVFPVNAAAHLNP